MRTALKACLSAALLLGTAPAALVSPASAQVSKGPLIADEAPAIEAVAGEPVSVDLRRYLVPEAAADARFLVVGLPQGLSASGGIVSGTPSEAGTRRARLYVASGGRWDWATLTVTVEAAAETGPGEDRLVYVSANMAVDEPDAILAVADRAKAAGANGVIFSDTKLTRYGVGNEPGPRWEAATEAVLDGLEERGMKTILNTVTLGYCGSILSADPSLTTGYEIKDQPLVLEGGVLVPVSTGTVENGGFERVSGGIPDEWDVFDDPGGRVRIDTRTARTGQSLRADAVGGQSSRARTSFAVEPFHQYTLSLWVRTEDLSADNLLVLVWDGEDRDRRLTTQHLSVPRGDEGQRDYFNRPDGLDLGWTEMRLAFNSQDAPSVEIMLGVFGGRSGTVWWDDVALSDTPTLNWVARDGLPRRVTRADGTELAFGADVAEIEDPKLGRIGYAGNFATYHDAPDVRPGASAALSEGDEVRLSGWHAQVTARGQVACSWNDPGVYDAMARVHARLQDRFAPDGFLLNYDEIRTGGWEPADRALGTSGQALAASIARATADLKAAAPDASVYFWGDMTDPFQNAVPKYYQVRGTLEGSWAGLDPSVHTVVTWRGQRHIAATGADGLRFFADRGFDQVIAGYYDADPQANFEAWEAARAGVPGITGTMYTTWERDFSDIEAFGRLWWAEAR